MTPAIEAFDHIHVYVADRAAAEQWYARVLGLHRAAEFESWATPRGPLTLTNPSGSVHLALFERPPAPNRAVIALRVGAAQFIQWLAHLRQEVDAAVSVEDHDLSVSLYFTDPDGNPYELTTYEYDEVKGRLTSAKTLEHYSERAADFWRGTRDHDVSQNIAALLRHIRGTPPFSILDFGCGPGRDLAALRALGHHPIGLEGTAAFAAMAREHSGCEVWEQDFLALHLPAARFDGIFANASLFHVPRQALPRVLAELHATLRPGGVLFSSNPRGDNEEGWNAGRYGVYHDLAGWQGFLTAAGFTELEHYYRPAGAPRDQQPWLASVWRKVASGKAED